MLSAEQKKKKQRLIRIVIACCLLLIPILGYVQRSLLSGQTAALPVSSTVLIFALININSLLLLLMLYLVLRNLVELVFERKQHLLGSRLRTRLVISFISLSFIPTAILFLVALRFVSTSMDYWFNARVEESLQASRQLAQKNLADTQNQVQYMGKHYALLLESGVVDYHNQAVLDQFFQKILAENLVGAPDSLLVLNDQRNQVVAIRNTRMQQIALQPPPSEALRLAEQSGQVQFVSTPTTLGELFQAIVPAQLAGAPAQTWFVIVGALVPSTQMGNMQAITEGLTGYQQMIMLKAPIKFSLLIMLLIVTLLILFGAIWFGFYIARSLTEPIKKLAEATKRVAAGDMEGMVEKKNDDEMGMLIDSFNSMTAKIRASNLQLAQTHRALEESTDISEQRRRYLETILTNVAAGVIALDDHNRITTINRFAEELLAIHPTLFLNKDFHMILPKQHALIVDSFLMELKKSGKATIERHLRIIIRRGEALSLQVNLTRMIDDRGQPIGFVFVFDNLTNLEKAQRLAAWQEVARRIAHEIKNPLTPIQLSAQRLRKRYLETIPDHRDIFDQCTATIIDQVEEIKNLVSEFSDFARMPQLHKEQHDLGKMVHEVAVLYQEAHKHLDIRCTLDPTLTEFLFDAVQIKRVLINLLDNAVSMVGAGGRIDIKLVRDQEAGVVRMSVADNGPGMSDEVKVRVFEPYFSTRKTGTGLGLAIAQTIVHEHGGRILVTDNEPQGAVFAVELPL